MKLKLTIDPPVNGHTYRPAELVQGRIELHYLKKAISEISHVRIVFQGTVRVALKPGFDAASQMAETYRQERYRVGGRLPADV